GLEPERAVEDGFEPAVADIDGLGLPLRSAVDDEVVPELAVLIDAVDKGELDVEHFAAPILARLEQAVLAGAAGAQAGGDRPDRPVGDELEIPRRWAVGGVKGHRGTSSRVGR